MKYFRINCSVGSNNLYMTSNRINTSCLTKLKQINLRKAVLFLDKFFNYFWRLQCTEMGFTIFPFGGFIIGTAVSQKVSWPNRKLENHNSVQWRQTGILLSYICVISSICVNKFAQKCQYYYTLPDPSVPLVTISNDFGTKWVFWHLLRHFFMY